MHSCSTSADGRSFLSHFHPACAACSILLADLTGPVQTQAVDGWKLVSIISHFAPLFEGQPGSEYTQTWVWQAPVVRGPREAPTEWEENVDDLVVGQG